MTNLELSFRTNRLFTNYYIQRIFVSLNILPVRFRFNTVNIVVYLKFSVKTIFRFGFEEMFPKESVYQKQYIFLFPSNTYNFFRNAQYIRDRHTIRVYNDKPLDSFFSLYYDLVIDLDYIHQNKYYQLCQVRNELTVIEW